MTNSPHFSKQFSFFFYKDSLGNTFHFGFPHPNFKLDSIRHHGFFFDDGDWFHKRHPDFYELEKRLQTLDSLLQHKLERFEALFDKFEEHNGKI